VVGRDGFDLVDIEYRRESAGWTLTLFIDKSGGVSLEDCQKVSRTLSTVLDVEDPIPHRYNLQVSSPGLDRPLRSVHDFEAAVGSRVRVTTGEPVDGRRNFAGRLASVSSEPAGEHHALHITDDTGTTRQVPMSAVRRANIVYEWPEPAAGPAVRGRRKAGRKAGGKR